MLLGRVWASESMSSGLGLGPKFAAPANYEKGEPLVLKFLCACGAWGRLGPGWGRVCGY